MRKVLSGKIVVIGDERELRLEGADP